jgi:hypothetical protein
MVKESQKKPYVKMRIEEVQLVPAEAVLGGCKLSDTTSAPSGGGIGCAVNSCVNDGTFS